MSVYWLNPKQALTKLLFSLAFYSLFAPTHDNHISRLDVINMHNALSSKRLHGYERIIGKQVAYLENMVSYLFIIVIDSGIYRISYYPH